MKRYTRNQWPNGWRKIDVVMSVEMYDLIIAEARDNLESRSAVVVRLIEKALNVKASK